MTDDRTDDILCHLYKILCDDVPSCGCGWPEDARRLVWDVLSLMPSYGEDKKQRLAELIGPVGSRQIVLNALQDAKLISHGVCVDSAWLEPHGRWFLWAVEQVGGIDGLSEQIYDAGYPHFEPPGYEGRECDDACWQVPDCWEPTVEPTPKSAPEVLAPCPGGQCPHYLYGVKHEHTARPE